jgi:hypothetical protein
MCRFLSFAGIPVSFLTDIKIREVERGMDIKGIDGLKAIQREFGINPLL